MEENVLSRNKENELVMVAMYDAITYITIKEEFSIEDILSGLFEMDYSDVPYFAKEVVIKSLVHINEIIPIFQEHMVKWAFDRLNNIIKAILITSYTKGKYLDEPIDKRVIIDTAVNLAKKFAEPSDYKFVNGILDNVL